MRNLRGVISLWNWRNENILYFEYTGGTMSLGSFASFIMSMVFISFKCITFENTCKGK